MIVIVTVVIVTVVIVIVVIVTAVIVTVVIVTVINRLIDYSKFTAFVRKYLSCARNFFHFK